MPPKVDYSSKIVQIHSSQLEDRYPSPSDTYIPVDVEKMQYLLEKPSDREMRFRANGQRLNLCMGRHHYVFWGNSESLKILIETVQRRWCRQEMILSQKLFLPSDILNEISSYLELPPVHTLPPPKEYVVHPSGEGDTPTIFGGRRITYRFAPLVSEKSMREWLKKRPQENPDSATSHTPSHAS